MLETDKSCVFQTPKTEYHPPYIHTHRLPSYTPHPSTTLFHPSLHTFFSVLLLPNLSTSPFFHPPSPLTPPPPPLPNLSTLPLLHPSILPPPSLFPSSFLLPLFPLPYVQHSQEVAKLSEQLRNAEKERKALEEKVFGLLQILLVPLVTYVCIHR